MFIRIKKRKLSDKTFKLSYDAVLLKTFRDEDGKVKQKQLKHLGTIRDKHLNLTHCLFWFYEKLEKGLLEFGIHDENEIKKLIKQCESKLGNRPSEKECDESLARGWKEFNQMK